MTETPQGGTWPPPGPHEPDAARPDGEASPVPGMPPWPPSLAPDPPGPVPAPASPGPVGTVRSTGSVLGLALVTLGIYGLVWFYKTHAEMKRHTGEGLGGGLALVLALVVGIVLPFITSHEVGRLYERHGRPRPVSAATGLWYFPGSLLIVGPLVWLVLTNRALNDYWRSQGAAA